MAITNKNKQVQEVKGKVNVLRVTEPAKSYPVYPDAKSEFISELSSLIIKWRGRPGKEADIFATTYENVLCQLLTPEKPEDKTDN